MLGAVSRLRTTHEVCFHRHPIDGVEAMSAHTAQSYPRHAHEEYGIGLVDAGGHSSWSDRGQVEAGPGDFITVNPGEVHDGQPVAAAPRAWRILYLAPRVLAELRADVGADDGRDPRLVAPVFTEPGLRPAFERAFACARRDVAMLEAESSLLLFVSRLGRKLAAPAREQGVPPPIAHARARLDDDSTMTPSLAELAAETASSRFQLLRGFAREFGLTPHAYLVQRRLTLARAQLRAGRPVAEVAASTGFCDQGHLTRSFRRHYGITPSRFAQRR
jgi:AraC-like DNA-binding protein